MAENVGILATMGGVCLWAHNGHVSRVPGFAGGYLRDALGEGYRAVVSVVGSGNTLAWYREGPSERRLATPPLDSLEGHLLRAGLPAGLYRMSDVPACQEPLRARTFGNAPIGDEFMIRWAASSAADYMMWVPATESARLLDPMAT